MRVLFWLLLLTILPAQFARGADEPVTIKADPSFAGPSASGVVPLSITLSNHTASLDGAIILRNTGDENGHRYIYPISLPSGSIKRIIAYPVLTSGSAAFTLTLESRVYRHEIPVPLVLSGEESLQVGMVGDNNGGLSALRGKPAREVGAIAGMYEARVKGSYKYMTLYTRPEDAPDRAIGYDSLAYLVLTEGSERMSTTQWAAIRQWVIGGGTLVLVGGAGSNYLRTSEAAALSPLTDLRSDVLPANTVLNKMAFPQRLPNTSTGDTALMTGTPQFGTTVETEDNGKILVASRPFGTGSVLFIAFDPTQQPFKNWVEVGSLWSNLLSKAPPADSMMNHLDELEGSSYTLPPGPSRFVRAAALAASRHALRRPGRVYGPPGTPDTNTNPFRVQLPPLQTVGWIFLAYFILVVPVTYIVLRQMRRLEWAWITSPLLSIACAYGLYLFTADLYKAGMSRRTLGTVTASGSEGRFNGYTELFLPHGGGYKIEVPQAELMESGLSVEMERRRATSAGDVVQPLDTVDNGTVVIPNLSVGNLSFRRVYHTQPFALSGAVTGQIRRDSSGKLVGTVRNGTRFSLHNVTLPNYGDSSHIHTMTVGDLAPGETKPITGTSTQESVFDNVSTQQGESAYLTGQIDGDTLGPELGKSVGGSTVRFVTTLPVTTGGG